MLKNAIKTNFEGGHTAKSGQKNAGGGIRRRRKNFAAEALGNYIRPFEEYIPLAGSSSLQNQFVDIRANVEVC